MWTIQVVEKNTSNENKLSSPLSSFTLESVLIQTDTFIRRTDEYSIDESDISPAPSTPWDFEDDIIKSQQEILVKVGCKKSRFNIYIAVRRWTLLILLVLLEVSISSVFIFDSTFGFIEHVYNDFARPIFALQTWTKEKEWNGGTYFDRSCDSSDQTAYYVSEIVADRIDIPTFTRTINLHGVQILPGLITEETASELRTFVLEQNKRNINMMDDVLASKNRFAFALQVDQHPSVSKAMKELFSNERLLDAFQATFGDRDPVVLELVVLTSVYGAKAQEWHPDVPGDSSATLYGLNFFDHYSLFIPLQNTTKLMGATDICPGTHMCNRIQPTYENHTTCFPVSGEHSLWQTGSGVMYNSRMVHRGAAHADPGVDKERVLLIPTFAPRPIASRLHRVETRSNPFGGVYGTHWTQFGFTVSDYRDCSRLMKYPWRVLHSFGLELPKYYRGWNYWDILVGRMLDEDTGDDVETWTKYLRLNFPRLASLINVEYDEESQEFDSEYEILLDFAETIMENARFIIISAQWLLLFIYLRLLIAVGEKVIAKRSVLRLFFAQGFVAILTGTVLMFVANSCWTKNISSGRLYNLLGDTSQFPNIAATIPNKDDILITTFLQSKSLGGFRRMVDESNPGNRYWLEDIVPQYSAGFNELTPALKYEVCAHIARMIAHDGRRILERNNEGNWGVPTKQDTYRYCHKALVADSSLITKQTVTDIDMLWADTKFGYFRHTALHRRFISHHLLSLQDRILRYRMNPKNAFKVDTSSNYRVANAVSYLPHIPSRRSKNDWNRLRSSMDLHPEPLEPYTGAWLTEGDIVDVRKRENKNRFCWYSGRIHLASGTKNRYIISIHSGAMLHAGPSQIRAHKEMEVDEVVEYRENNGNYFAGILVDVYDNEYVDVVNLSTNQTLTISNNQIRRECETR